MRNRFLRVLVPGIFLVAAMALVACGSDGSSDSSDSSGGFLLICPADNKYTPETFLRASSPGLSGPCVAGWRLGTYFFCRRVAAGAGYS